MYNKKSLFVTFEGIEGSGKSYQSKKLFKKIKSMGLPVIYSREPGGSTSAEEIRKVILTGPKNKFAKVTDALLYLAARNEHFEKKLKPAILKKKIIICDRFYDSTLAYQVYGGGVDKSFVDFVNKKILGSIKPDLTFILKLNLTKAFQRVRGRRSQNRYDKFPKKFYREVQKSFGKIAKTNKKRCVVLDTSKDTIEAEMTIFKKFIKVLNR